MQRLLSLVRKCVAEYKMIKKGDIIGGIGTAGAFEEEDGHHLHFEMQKGEDYVNPVSYFYWSLFSCTSFRCFQSSPWRVGCF